MASNRPRRSGRLAALAESASKEKLRSSQATFNTSPPSILSSGGQPAQKKAKRYTSAEQRDTETPSNSPRKSAPLAPLAESPSKRKRRSSQVFISDTSSSSIVSTSGQLVHKKAKRDTSVEQRDTEARLISPRNVRFAGLADSAISGGKRRSSQVFISDTSSSSIVSTSGQLVQKRADRGTSVEQQDTEARLISSRNIRLAGLADSARSPTDIEKRIENVYKAQEENSSVVAFMAFRDFIINNEWSIILLGETDENIKRLEESQTLDLRNACEEAQNAIIYAQEGPYPRRLMDDPALAQKVINTLNNAKGTYPDNINTGIFEINPELFKRIPKQELVSEFEEKVMVVRPATIEAFETFTKYSQMGHTTFILTGNPGIGKTLSLWYFLIRCIKEDKPVIWVSWNYKAAYLFNKRGVLAIHPPYNENYENIYNDVIEYTQGTDDWESTVCLVNSGIQAANYPVEFNALGRYIVVASSPNIQRVQQWRKYRKMSLEYVMAPPSVEEVVALVSKIVPGAEKHLIWWAYHTYHVDFRTCRDFVGRIPLDKNPKDLDPALLQALLRRQKVIEAALENMEQSASLQIFATHADEEQSRLTKITNQLVLAQPAKDSNGNIDHETLQHVLATNYITRLMLAYVKRKNITAQKNLCNFLAGVPEMRTAAGKLYESMCHLFLTGQKARDRPVQWYERKTEDIDINSDDHSPETVPWASLTPSFQLRDLPINSMKAAEALADYAKALQDSSACYIRPRNLCQTTWDALILQKDSGQLVVHFLQMSYSKDHEINYKGLHSVREALSDFRPHFTYVLILHPDENQTWISRKQKIDFHINERTPSNIVKPIWESQTREFRDETGVTYRSAPSLKVMKEHLNGDRHDWAKMKQYVIPVSIHDVSWD